MKSSLAVVVVCSLGAPVWAQHAPQAAAGGGYAPTRMEYCQRDLGGLQGDARKRALSECLVRRLEGERLVARECRRQVREVPAAANQQWQLQRECETRALSVPTPELPQRPAAASREVADATFKPVDAAAPSAEAAPAPAAAPARSESTP